MLQTTIEERCNIERGVKKTMTTDLFGKQYKSDNSETTYLKIKGKSLGICTKQKYILKIKTM